MNKAASEPGHFPTENCKDPEVKGGYTGYVEEDDNYFEDDEILQKENVEVSQFLVFLANVVHLNLGPSIKV